MALAQSDVRITSEQEDSNDRTPLWKYVTRVNKVAGGGNVTFKCSYCGGTFKGSYSRVKAHLLKLTGFGIRVCSSVTPQQLIEMRMVVEQADVKACLPIQVLLPSSASNKTCSSTSGTSATPNMMDEIYDDGLQSKKRKVTCNTAIEEASNCEDWKDLDSLIARMFYSGGLPFNLAKNPYFIASYTKAVSNSKTLQGYIPPSYDSLRTTLLQNERANVERHLEPIKNVWKQKGVSLVTYGWTDGQKRPTINFMATCESGTVFLKAVNRPDECKDEFFIANLIKGAISEVGPQNVIQVITDDALVCKNAGLLIEAQFPHIFWTPCVVHTLNLALNNILAAEDSNGNASAFEECGWIKETIKDAMVMKNFIMNHSMRFSMFSKHSKLKLLSIADSHFASSIVMLRRLKQIKQSLKSMVSSKCWMSQKEDDVRNVSFVKEKVLDEIWWGKVDYILSFTEPIYDMFRIANIDRPSLHLVYDMWESMIKKVKTTIYRHEAKRQDEKSSFHSIVHKILVDGWNKSKTPLHCLAHSLNPRYYSGEWLQASRNRVPPHKDKELSSERHKCFERYFPDAVERRQVNSEYAKFSAALREFADSDSVNDRGLMEPDLWWAAHGYSAPLLQSLALKILGHPCSSCCERNWSNCSTMNSLKMNEITPQRGDDLVFVYSNLRLLSRNTSQYTRGETRMSDGGENPFNSLEDATAFENGELSHDEQELEACANFLMEMERRM